MIGNSIAAMPGELQALLREYVIDENTIGCSGATVLHLKGGSNAAYLKVESAENGGLEREAAILNWLQRRLPVPRVHYFARYHGQAYLLMSEVPGLDISFSTDSPEAVIKVMAAGLRQIHGLDTSGCQYSHTLTVKIPLAKSRAESGHVDQENFEPQYSGKTALELLDILLEKIPDHEDLVFTHGDYCPENIIIQNERLSGFIDWGRAGVADRYQDIALAVRSIRHTWEMEHLVDLFFSWYGLRDVDYSKIDFYILLDEFF